MGDENRLINAKTDDRDIILENYEHFNTVANQLNDNTAPKETVDLPQVHPVNLSEYEDFNEEFSENNTDITNEEYFDESDILDFEMSNNKALIEADLAKSTTLPSTATKTSPAKTTTGKLKENRIYYVGMFSASLSLVIMGLILIISLFTVGGVRNALKMSPIILVFLGLELGANWYFRTGKRLRFDIRGYAVSILMILISAGLSFFSVATSNSDRSRENLEKRYERELQNLLIKDLKDTNVNDLKTVNISFSSYERDISSYSTLRDIKDTDILEAEFFFRNSHKTLSDFSSDCEEILELLERYDLPFGNIDFIADDRLNSVKVSVNPMFDTEISKNEIARLAYYFSGEFHNDLEDYDTEE